MQKLGGDVIELNSKDIGFDNNKRDFKDILSVLSQFINCIMIRNNNR